MFLSGRSFLHWKVMISNHLTATHLWRNSTQRTFAKRFRSLRQKSSVSSMCSIVMRVHSVVSMVNPLSRAVSGGIRYGTNALAGKLANPNNPLNNGSGSSGETYYRTMSQEHYGQLTKIGNLPAMSETYISPNAAYSQQYTGVTVKFNVRAGTTDALKSIGVSNKQY